MQLLLMCLMRLLHVLLLLSPSLALFLLLSKLLLSATLLLLFMQLPMLKPDVLAQGSHCTV